MKTSDLQTNLIAALLECQKAFPPIEKSKEGQAGNRKFRYAPLETIKAQCDPILRQNNIVLTQGTMGHFVVTRLDHISGEWREIMMPMNEVHSSDQAYGIEFSYKRRYSYTGILGIVTEDDVDGNKAKIAKPGVLGPGESLHHTVRGGIGEDLPEDWKIYLRDLADEVSALVNNGKVDAAKERINDDKLDDDQRVYMENHIEPKVRRALKGN